MSNVVAKLNVDTDQQSTEIPPEKLAIELNNVTVAYRSYNERPTSLKETTLRFLKSGKTRYHSPFNALSDVSFKVKKGEIFAFIGSNGAGKSTLLKVLTGVLKPTLGSAVVNGSIASLIELGVGFNNELNAVENIYLNGALYRKSKAEISKRVDHIIEFAELAEFAHTPIKYYSSGMAARLGFACAVDINPDVLLVDEILSVGDERFQIKCAKVFDEFLASGKTIVMVSHDLGMVERRASRVGLLSRGQLIYVGDPKTAIAHYRDEDYKTRLTD